MSFNISSNYSGFNSGLTDEEALELVLVESAKEQHIDEKIDSSSNIKRKFEDESINATNEDMKSELTKVLKVSHDILGVQKDHQRDVSTTSKEEVDEITMPVTHTVGEKWVDHKISFLDKGIIAVFHSTIGKSIIEKFIKDLSEQSKSEIRKATIHNFNTLGDIEKFAITIINREDKTNSIRKRSHEGLKSNLRVYADKGWGAFSDILKKM